MTEQARADQLRSDLLHDAVGEQYERYKKEEQDLKLEFLDLLKEVTDKLSYKLSCNVKIGIDVTEDLTWTEHGSWNTRPS